MSWFRGHFDVPPTPDGTAMPHTAQLVATAAMAVLVAGFAGYAVREIARSRSGTLALLLIGGAISYFNEPIDDVLGLVWHPVVGQRWDHWPLPRCCWPRGTRSPVGVRCICSFCR
jgi:hypothetical protein